MLLNILNKNDGNISCDFSEQYCEQKLKFQKKKKKNQNRLMLLSNCCLWKQKVKTH